MQGEGGNDTIYGGQDNGRILRDLTTGKLTELVIGDNLYGNDGQDTYYYAQGDGIDLIWDFRPGEDVIKISGFNPQDVKVTFVRGVTNRIGTPGHDKLALFFGNDAGAIVFNDFPGPKTGDVILDFGTSQLTWFDLLSIANTQIGDTVVSAVPAGPSPDPNYNPTGTGTPVELSGGNGNDILNGGTGADRLYGNDGYNWLEGFTGDDQLFGGNAQDVLVGAEGRDRLYGNEGVNWIDGGADDDELYGGNVQDTLLGGSGNDTIYSNGGDDLLVGGAGADKLYGTGGTDIIYGDDAVGIVFTPPAKPVIEPPPPPPPVPDSVTTSTSLTLAPGVRNVTATGKASVSLTGNELDNVMTGNTGKNTISAGAGNDVINGGYGNDRLYGSTGKDAFVFTTKLGTSTTDRTVNLDTISDFSVKDDTLQLDNAVFKKIGKAGKLNKAYFTIGEQAKDKNDYVIYNKKTGILSYDADGSGSGKAVEFAKLAKNLKLTSADFFTI
jgi:Ca2+-binding RTX toxin-like protein